MGQPLWKIVWQVMELFSNNRTEDCYMLCNELKTSANEARHKAQSK
jgi:hypothetical protein